VTNGTEHAPRVRALLLDVEGTTTPVSFVYDVLFPYARSHLRAYLAAHLGSADMNEAAAMLADEWVADVAGDGALSARPPAANDLGSLRDYLNALMDRDRKSPGLKLIQGRIWEQGYRDGQLRGQVFADVPRALARWNAAGLTIAIYSSGSVLAQRMLFAHSDAGDLTRSIAHYFDTSVGPKRSPESYARIAVALRLAPAEVAFVSDVDAELEAARDAGCRVVMCVRPGNSTEVSRIASTARWFDEIDGLLRLSTQLS
jgi:enolase-phosphatase E1